MSIWEKEPSGNSGQENKKESLETSPTILKEEESRLKKFMEGKFGKLAKGFILASLVTIATAEVAIQRHNADLIDPAETQARFQKLATEGKEQQDAIKYATSENIEVIKNYGDGTKKIKITREFPAGFKFNKLIEIVIESESGTISKFVSLKEGEKEPDFNKDPNYIFYTGDVEGFENQSSQK